MPASLFFIITNSLKWFGNVLSKRKGVLEINFIIQLNHNFVESSLIDNLTETIQKETRL